MAENTFAVTQNPPGKEARVDWVSTARLQADRYAEPATANGAGSTPMVSCGFPIRGTEICIVSESGEVLPGRSVGEIALRSDCMLSEYYRRPDLTEMAIRKGWHYTGDMGYLADGELFVSGRKKDLIIVGGKNIYPQDLEAIANSTPGIIPGRSVAFGLFDQNLGSENIVMVCELENPAAAGPEKKKIEMLLRGQVVQQSEVALSDVLLVEERWLIKTSSGKISRTSNREKYLREFIGS
jgi:acyl-CoA synthetase (AMP-forming)/AMP-acid ligase II